MNDSQDNLLIALLVSASFDGVSGAVSAESKSLIIDALESLLGTESSTDFDAALLEALQDIENMLTDIENQIQTLSLDLSGIVGYDDMLQELPNILSPYTIVSTAMKSLCTQGLSESKKQQLLTSIKNAFDSDSLNKVYNSASEVNRYSKQVLTDFAGAMLTAGTNNFQFAAKLGGVISQIASPIFQTQLILDTAIKAFDKDPGSGTFLANIDLASKTVAEFATIKSTIDTITENYSLSNSKICQLMSAIIENDFVQVSDFCPANDSKSLNLVRIVRNSVSSFDFKSVSSGSLGPFESFRYNEYKLLNYFPTECCNLYTNVKLDSLPAEVPLTWLVNLADTSESGFQFAIGKTSNFSLENGELAFYMYKSGDFSNRYQLSLRNASNHFYGYWPHKLYASVTDDSNCKTWTFMLPKNSRTDAYQPQGLALYNINVTDGRHYLAYLHDGGSNGYDAGVFLYKYQSQTGYQWPLYEGTITPLDSEGNPIS